MEKLDFDKFRSLLKKNNSLNESKLDMTAIVLETERKANLSVATLSIILSVLYAVFLVLAICKVYFADSLLSIITLAVCLGLHIIALSICFVLKGNGKWLKYMLFIIISIAIFGLNIISGYEYWIILSIPILMSINYFRPRFTIMISTIIEILFAISIVLSAIVSIKSGWIDVNYAGNFNGKTLLIGNGISNAVIESSAFSAKEYIKNMYLYTFLPHSLSVIALALIAIQSTRHGWNILIEESESLVAKTKAEKEAADSKTQIMLSQIQPHFIYNTLNSIYYLCDKEPETAKNAIAEFSDYLRTNLNFMDKKAYVSFEQELEHIKKYLSLEKMRFEDELNYEFDIQCSTFKVPALSIQPLVENAVKHGVCKRMGGGTVKISAVETIDYFVVSIVDDGVGFDVDKPFDDKRRHIGLENTRARLVDMCNAIVEIQSEIGRGTTVIIKLPKENYYEDTGSR